MAASDATPSYEDGKRDQRLGQHDAHFAKLNGSVGELVTLVTALRTDMVAAVNEIKMAVQQLGSDAVNERANVVTTAAAVKETAVTTAAALKDAEEARRDKSEQSWLTPQRMLGALVALAAIAAAIIGIANGAGP